MKRWNNICLCLLTAATVVHAQKAENILGKAAAAYEQSNGITASLAVSIRAEKQGGAESFEAVIEMKGDRFRLTTPDMRTWYDGKTLWMYSVRAGEVSISNPSGDELQTLNPMILLRGYEKGFKASYTGESTSDLGRMADDVKLVSKGNGDIEEVDLQIDRTTALPVRISALMNNGVRSVIRIAGMKTGVNQPETLFTFNAAEYPEALEVDLRP
ncbi:MAG: hypothetical protein LBK07_10205 [Tannerella sp.]|nr:hypothetical protein [Tannerella sp.]